MSVDFTPFRERGGWLCGFLRSTVRKNGEQAERITLCACTCSSSQVNVTSKKSLSSLNSRKAQLMLLSKSFHRRQNFSDISGQIISSFNWKLCSSAQQWHQAGVGSKV